LASALLDRLTLSAKSVAAMAEGLRQIAQLRDPVGEISDLSYRPSGIQVGRMRVPLGVVAIIYGLRAVGLAPVSFAFAMIWLAFCVYSWVVPPLVRRWINRRWGS